MNTAAIRYLPSVVAPPPDKPDRAGAAASREVSRAIAADPATWTAAMAAQTVRRYADLAPAWDSDRGGYRYVPLDDALARGGPWPIGPCVEVGCGTGLLTQRLAAHWPRVIGVDLSPDMLRRSRAPWRLLADASRLPLAGGQAAAVVLADVPLFAEEVVRVLAADGVVVWSNALGRDAPHHVPVPVVLDALRRADRGRRWMSVTADAGWGLWAVLRR